MQQPRQKRHRAAAHGGRGDNEPRISSNPEGSVIKSLQSNCSVSRAVVLNDMEHGFVNRGDVSDEKVKEGVKTAIELATSFLKEHLELTA